MYNFQSGRIIRIEPMICLDSKFNKNRQNTHYFRSNDHAINPNQNNHIINGLQYSKYFKRMATLNIVISITLIIQLILQYCYIEFDIISNQLSVTFLNGSLICGCFSCLICILKGVSQNQYNALKANKQDKYIKLLINSIICLMMPYNFFEGQFVEFVDINDSNLMHPQKINHIITILATLKIITVLESALMHSRYSGPQSDRITNLYQSNSGILFATKCIFKDKPFTMLIFTFFISVTIFSYAFRISEAAIYPLSDISTIYSNMIWMTIITMTSVGYGDYAPQTPFGRFIGCLCVSWGMFIISVMIVVLLNSFSMSGNEQQSLVVLNKLGSKTQLRQIAGNLIRQTLWRVWKNYKFDLNKQQNLRQRKLRSQFYLYRRKKSLNKNSLQQGIDFQRSVLQQFTQVKISLQNLITNNRQVLNFMNQQFFMSRWISKANQPSLDQSSSSNSQNIDQ